MANNGIVIGGVLATIGIVFGIFVLLNSMPEAQDGELIVSCLLYTSDAADE